MEAQQTSSVAATAPPADAGGGLKLPPANRDRTAARDVLNALRQYHHGLVDAPLEKRPPADWLPALLHAYRAPQALRTDYPLVLLPLADGDRVCAPLTDLLHQAAQQLAPGADDARVLNDNLTQFERCVRDELDAAAAPVDAAPVLRAAAARLKQTLALEPNDERELTEQLAKLLAKLPAESRLLALTDFAAVALWTHVAGLRFHAHRTALRNEVARLHGALHDLQRADATRRVDAADSSAVSGAIAQGADLVDPSALARIMASANKPAAMDSERRSRIAASLATLRDFLDHEPAPPFVIVYDAAHNPTFAAQPADVAVERDADVCRSAAAVFDELVTRHAALFAAIRTARLELAHQYDPGRHGRLFEDLRWEALTREELLSLPRVLALPAAPHVAGPGMAELSRLLASGRPVQLLVAVDPAFGVSADEALHEYRFELAYLGLSHREALVHQSTAVRPGHLTAGFVMSMDATAASLHVVTRIANSSGDAPRLGAWLHTGAALEGRAHALFHYNPGAGDTWARRFHFVGNPAPAENWPSAGLNCRTAEDAAKTLNVAFTFADFALLEPKLRGCFAIIPDDVPADALTPLAEFLELSAEDAIGALPYIWAADEDDALHRLVVDRPLALACRDRLGYWRTLQEFAGVRNEYAREAVARERDRLATEFAAERKLLEETHAAALEQVRREAVTEAMQRLAQTLLGLDLSAARVPTVAPTAAPPPIEKVPAAAPAAAPQAAEQPNSSTPAEPWITSALCTSCNECINLNPQMFAYNANKQAVIKDARAGSYAQLVKAAEKCPASCIHPGLPLDPNERNAAKLIERAKPYN